jgi:hypothetical protein
MIDDMLSACALSDSLSVGTVYDYAVGVAQRTQCRDGCPLSEAVLVLHKSLEQEQVTQIFTILSC